MAWQNVEDGTGGEQRSPRCALQRREKAQDSLLVVYFLIRERRNNVLESRQARLLALFAAQTGGRALSQERQLLYGTFG